MRLPLTMGLTPLMVRLTPLTMGLTPLVVRPERQETHERKMKDR